ncbi:RNA polymerase sigma factor [Niallia sp. 03133]|uniref:RNA polymerase sigma factor n=1 Tax=Niallia sp. 03133 TaxID=3458060 RepID=UPI0040445CB1
MRIANLVKKAKKGNKEALLQLIMLQKEDYYKLAYTYMGNNHDAMDVMEDMIVCLYENIHQLKKENSFYSWSKTILVNNCKSLLKSQQKLLLVEEWNEYKESEKEYASTINSIHNKDQKMDIQQLLTTLNEHQAEAIRLKYFHDLDYQSISDMTNVSVGTVKSRIFHGLKKLKIQYGGKIYE